MLPSIQRSRVLQAEDDVFSQNAWDDMEWTDDMFKQAKERIEEQRKEAECLSIDLKKVEDSVDLKWNEFYHTHGDKFFKDRRWIFSEFPEILPYIEEGGPQSSLLEVGCGVGNAILHVIESNKNSNFNVYCCDVSSNAIETLKQRDVFLKNSKQITAFQADVCKDFDLIRQETGLESLDFITMIFTLSALRPEFMKKVIENLTKLLKPNGMIFFRDYAQYDMTQLRFKGRSYLGENYYLRVDGTTSYFFSQDLVDNLFTAAGLKKVELKNDNRLLVNRSKSLKMWRCWIQAKYRRFE